MMRISVCMATYNGARFLREQLDSILQQLKHDDEIIIVDDASTDATLEVLADYQDTRVRVFPQSQNGGVIKAFNHAIQQSRGDIIFLADQDDIWRGDKVEKVKMFFADHPEVTLVQSNYSVIDSLGNAVEQSTLDSRVFRRGVLQNIFQNRYRGCTMAFRRSILEYCMPFPENVPMHDMWIGIVNDIVGLTALVNEPLVLYRRHGANASPDRHASLAGMLRWRWNLTTNLASLYVRSILPNKFRKLIRG